MTIRAHRDTVTISGCPIDRLSLAETVDRVNESIQSGGKIKHGVVDAGKLALMADDPELFHAVTTAEIISCDGQSLVWLSRLYGYPLPERVAGVDLFEALLKLADREHYEIYLFGARKDILKKCLQRIAYEYPGITVAGSQHGYFDRQATPRIAEDIAVSGADMLFVALGSPEKEMFLHDYDDRLGDVTLRMGVGGSFDVYVGDVKRAPKWIQRSGFEWFYRFLQEPRKKFKGEVADSFRFLLHLARVGRHTSRRSPY